MKKYSVLVGGLTFLVLMIGAFLVPVQAANAAPATTYNHSLPGETLTDGILTTIATVHFRSERRGTISLMTTQKADLGAVMSFSSWHNVSIYTALDGTMIEGSSIHPSHGNPPLTQLGIRVSAFVEPGLHTMALTYLSTCINSSSRPSLGGPCSGSAPLYPGRLTLRVPGK